MIAVDTLGIRVRAHQWISIAPQSSAREKVLPWNLQASREGTVNILDRAIRCGIDPIPALSGLFTIGAIDEHEIKIAPILREIETRSHPTFARCGGAFDCANNQLRVVR